MCKQMYLIAGVSVVCLVLALGLGGCKSGHGKEISPDVVSGAPGGSETTSGAGLPDVDQEAILFDKASGLQSVYFDFDSYALRPDALETLKVNAEKIKATPSVIIQIEGHCDERGTAEYNLALGERRALATREHLIRLGVSGDRLVTISYGEEDPADPGHDEAAWAKNRRCEFNKSR